MDFPSLSYIPCGIMTSYMHFQRYKHLIDICYTLKIYFAKTKPRKLAEGVQCHI